MLKNVFESETERAEAEKGKWMNLPRKPKVPDGMFQKCEACKKILYSEDVKKNAYCCPECGKHFRIGARQRIGLVVDKDSFEEWDAKLTGKNPLEFPDYEEKLEILREQTGLKEAVVTGAASIRGNRTAIGAMSADFLMGSMGTVVGEKITRMVERATASRLPVILFCCSGGARMQEGIFSLMQMAKTSQALKRHEEAGLLYISVLTDPTTGGVTASFAMLGDIILAEPGTLIGFAGPRVIKQTIGQKLPEGFQTAEFLMQHGFVDRIVRRDKMRKTLAVLLQSGNGTSGKNLQAGNGNSAQLLQAPEGDAVKTAWEEPENRECADEELRKGGLQAVPTENSAGKIVLEEGAEDRQGKSPWERVEIARSSRRPYTSDYISKVFDGFLELRGDRLFGDDRAVIGGIAALQDRYVTVIGLQKGRNLKENKHRNFGMANPEGYRKALRLMKQAEKFGRPIILFVDTPGAFCGVEGEERGQGEAIARNLFEMSALKVPVLTIITGEGGSGGALALAVSNEVWMLENSVYSVLSPEGFASILWKDGKRAKEAAKVMKMTAAELQEFGIIDKVLLEREPADVEHMEELAQGMRAEIQNFLSVYETKSREELLGQRYAKFRKMGKELLIEEE